MRIRHRRDRLGRRLRWRLHPDAKWAAVAWITIAIALTLVQFFAHRWGGREARPRVSAIDLEWLFGGWVGRDSRDYLMIAEGGYSLERLLVVFPGFPLVLKGISLLGEPRAWGVLVAAAFGLMSALGLAEWCHGVGLDGRSTRAAVLALLISPYAWYLYGPLYGDSMFLAATIWAFVAVQRGRYAAAGLLGMVASATRPTGYAVAIALTLAVLDAEGVLTRAHASASTMAARLGLPTGLDRARLRATRTARNLAAVSLSWLGLGAYMGWLAVRRGSPFAWITAQRLFHSTGSATLLKEEFVSAFWSNAPLSRLVTTSLSALILAASFVVVPIVGRRFGWAPAALILLSAIMPAVSVATFMGVGRYQLVAFPAFALVGATLANHRRAALLAGLVSIALLVAFSIGFSRGAYLA
ncbi:MAG: hypothetical protein V9E99_03530 [Microthrixaceae bacterium]